MPVVKRAPAALSGTSMGFVAPKGPALPFQKDAALPARADPQRAPPSHASAESTSAGSPSPKPAEPAPPAATAPTIADPAAPAPIAAPAAPVALTLEQYASLCVELTGEGANAGEVLHRYGLTVEQGRAVDTHWKAQVAADPAARAAYDRAYNAYRAWLLSARLQPAKP
jgi:hypothetical protein